jgi:hypothetical protein
MNEIEQIQQAFEKHILNSYGEYYASLERWNPEWTSTKGQRYYASAILEQDFAFFRAGYFAGLEKRIE